MARPLRLEVPGAYYHVLARGNARQDIFLDDQDRLHFLATLGESVQRHGLLVHAYCLMRNHYHLIVETVRSELSRTLKRLNGIYSQFFNRRHERVGHLFQGRFKSLLIDKNAYFLAAHRYIHQNPVRKGLTSHAADYEWSSCRDFLGIRRSPPWLRTDLALGYYHGDADEKMAAYAVFVETPAKENPFEKSYAQAFLGSPEFVESMRRRASAVASGEHPAHRAFEVRPEPATIAPAIAQELKNSTERLLGWRRPAQSLEMYFLRERALVPLDDLARQFGVSPSAISHQVAKVKASLERHRGLRNSIERIDAILTGQFQISRSDPSL
ncbi:MAG: transposase [Elusimicrobia bacterium]|nr:transposase [Elusimicrobiota bacterium]